MRSAASTAPLLLCAKIRYSAVFMMNLTESGLEFTSNSICSHIEGGSSLLKPLL
jgi:hypothetical protein